MNRRDFLLGATACFLTNSVLAQTVPKTVLIELINFHCSRCRAVNEYTQKIRNAAESIGVSYLVAPIAWAGQSMWPDRVYYAVKALFPAALDFVRDALFDGIHIEGQKFEELTQVMVYIERTAVKDILKIVPDFKPSLVLEKAMSEDVMMSEMKAGLILDQVIATQVPVFVWLQNGEIVTTITTDIASEPAPMVNAVLTKLESMKG